MKILVSDPLSEEGLKILRDTKEFQVDVKTELKPEELKEVIRDYEALIVRSATKVTKDVIAAAKRLKIIGRAGVGLDNVDLEAATERGIIVMNTPTGNTISTAEHTMSMMLSLSHNIPGAHGSLKKGEWKRSKFMGVELYGKTLGVVGLGKIGSEVARRALSFGMKVIAYDPYLNQKVAQQLGVEAMGLSELLARADYITLHVPLTDETKYLISKKEFSQMKPGVRVINCARGGIVDEEALWEALKEGKVAGAALDVFEKEPPVENKLLQLDNVVVTPHLGASTEEAQVNVAVEIAQAVIDALLGKGIRNAANYPCVEPEVFKLLEPYIKLSEKIGLLAGQLIEGPIVRVDITYSGQLTQYDTTALTMGLLKGILSPMLQETVNFVNAVRLAQERGIRIEEIRTTKEEEFVNLIAVETYSEKHTKKVAGTLFTQKDARIVKIDEFRVEAIPEGYMLIMENWDRPGVIGHIGLVMGKHNINIAGMNFGREHPGGKAITVLNIDSPVLPAVLEEIKKNSHILSVKSIKL